MSDLFSSTSLRTDENGRVRFSGIGSGIDFGQTVEDLIAAKRIPVDRIEADITSNQERITALQGLRTLLDGLQSSLSGLYGARTVDNSGDIFSRKSAFATTSRSDGQAASQAGNLIGVTVSPTAASGITEVEILQTARAHRIASESFSSTTDDLGTASGGAAGSISGTFQINGTEIQVLATDSLNDLVDRINNANSGVNATGVSASIVSVSSNENILVLTADETGVNMTIGNETGGVLASLGSSADGGTTFVNELQVAQKAQLNVNGLLDNSAYQSAAVTDPAAALSSYTTLAAGAQSFEIRADGVLLGTVNYTNADSLNDLASTINAITGVTASVETVGGESRLKIAADGGGALSFTADSANAVTELGLTQQQLVIERNSNTVADLIEGVTLDLFQAEVGTTISLDIQQDLNAVKTTLQNFVVAYNEVKVFINQNSPDTVDPENGGVLFGTSVISDLESRLSSIIGSGADGVSEAFTVFQQVGIEFVDNATLSDPLLADTLTIDDTELDNALLSNLDDVKSLFTFEFSSSDPRVSLIGFDGNAQYSETGYKLNIDFDETDGNSVASANIDGAGAGTNDGSVTADGRILTVGDQTGANGLRLFYSGDSDLADVQIDFTVGLGAKLFFELDSLLDPTNGLVEGEITSLEDQNTVAQERADQMLERIERERVRLNERFSRLEATLASLDSQMRSLQAMIDAQNNSNN